GLLSQGITGSRIERFGSGERRAPVTPAVSLPFVLLLPLILLLLLLLEKLKNLRHPLPDDLPAPGASHFPVPLRDVQLPHPLPPSPRSLRPHRSVLVALHDDHGDVLDLVEVLRLAARSRRDGSQAGPEVRVLRPEVPSAAAAHRVADQVNALVVD